MALTNGPGPPVSPDPKPPVREDVLARWQDMVNLLAQTVRVPIGLVTRVSDTEGEVIAGSTGKGNPFKRGDRAPRNPALYCEHVIASRQLLMVPDATADPAWSENPDMERGLVAYLGLPIEWPDGKIFGTLCLLDRKPRRFSARDQRLIEQFRESVESELALLLKVEEAQRSQDALAHANTRLQEEMAAREEVLAALRASEQRYRSFFDSPLVGTTLTSPEKGFIEVNDTLCALLGYTREELLAQTWANITHPDDLEESVHQLRRMLAGEIDAQAFVKRYIHKDGHIVLTRVATRAVRRPDGSVEHFASVCEDITESRRAEEEVAAYRQHLESLVAERTANLTEANSRLLLEGGRRERVEESLREYVQRFRTVFRQSPFAIVVGDALLRFHEINPAMERLLGYTLDELNRLGLRGVTHPDDLEENFELLRDLLEGKREHYQVERRFYRKDGRVVWCNLTTSLLRDADGRPLFAIGMIEDVTQRKEAEEALRRSEERFRVFQETSLDGFVSLRAVRDHSGAIADFLCEYANPAAVRIVGREVVTRRHTELFPGSGRGTRQFQNYVGVVETGVPLDMEFYYEADGLKGWFRNMIVKLDDGIVISFSDVTARKRAEQERLHLATAVEQAAEAILITDAHGVIEYVNPAFERISGYTREEALGQTPRILNSGKQDAEFYRRMWETILAGEVWRGQLVNRRKDGAHYVEQLSITPLHQDGGAITHFVAIVEDVSDRQQLEAQFRQAQKLEAVGRLAGGVAHDFNNLLTAILGSADLLLAQLHPHDPLQEEVCEIKRAGERAATLTRQLLAFSRRQILQPRIIHLNEIVSNMEKMLRRLIGEDIHLESSLVGDLHPVKVDPGQVEQVLLNLVVNARDAMPAGGKLLIETRNVSLDGHGAFEAGGIEAGDYVELGVTDTGSGIGDDIAAHIFEPFFTTKEDGKGTGLGLSTVYGIARQSGGSITFRSVAGSGTTFCVYFPAAEGTTEAPAPETALRPHPGTETILVAEDEEIVRTLICRVLRQQGYRVIETRNGPEALAVLRGHGGPIHLMVSDVIMPGMYGPELAAQALRHRPDLRVLFITGHADRFLAEVGSVEGAAPILPKPFTPDVLTRTVREVLSRSG